MNVTRKAFKGRMLVTDFETGAGGYDANTVFSAAQGAKGGLALWVGSPPCTTGFFTYDTFEEAVAEDFGQPADGLGWPGDFLSAVSSARGEDYAEEIEL